MVGSIFVLIPAVVLIHRVTAIMLSRFKIGYPAIRQALLDLDDAILSIDELKAISKQLPTTEEVRESLSHISKADLTDVRYPR